MEFNSNKQSDKLGAWIKVVMLQVVLALPLVWMHAVGVL